MFDYMPKHQCSTHSEYSKCLNSSLTSGRGLNECYDIEHEQSQQHFRLLRSQWYPDPRRTAASNIEVEDVRNGTSPAMQVDDGLTMTDASMLLNIYALQSCSNMGDVYRFRPDAVIAANEKAACERILGTLFMLLTSSIWRDVFKPLRSSNCSVKAVNNLR